MGIVRRHGKDFRGRVLGFVLDDWSVFDAICERCVHQAIQVLNIEAGIDEIYEMA